MITQSPPSTRGSQIRSTRSQAEHVEDDDNRQHGFDEIVGQSGPWREVLRKIGMVADTDSSVLLLGETGTGKELLARAVHERSRRAHRPLVKVNCAALPGSLLESELFGHVAGAFTGATGARAGRFELANGGTLFLDEIGELNLQSQAKLLRVLQEGEFERVGGTETLKVDVRIVAATNCDLKQAISEGEFRSDLFYRLAVFPIEIPPLRERRDDIPMLVRHFLTEKQKRIGKSISEISDDVMQALVDCDWPGNVRELENVVERAMILSPGPALCVKDVHLEPAAISPPEEQPTTLEEAHRTHISRVLKECCGRIKGPGNAAERLDMNPSTLRYRMKKLGIRPRQEAL